MTPKPDFNKIINNMNHETHHLLHQATTVHAFLDLLDGTPHFKGKYIEQWQRFSDEYVQLISKLLQATELTSPLDVRRLVSFIHHYQDPFDAIEQLEHIDRQTRTSRLPDEPGSDWDDDCLSCGGCPNTECGCL